MFLPKHAQQISCVDLNAFLFPMSSSILLAIYKLKARKEGVCLTDDHSIRQFSISLAETNVVFWQWTLCLSLTFCFPMNKICLFLRRSHFMLHQLGQSLNLQILNKVAGCGDHLKSIIHTPVEVYLLHLSPKSAVDWSWYSLFSCSHTASTVHTNMVKGFATKIRKQTPF